MSSNRPWQVPGCHGSCRGLFEDTLHGFLAENDEPIAFLHLDADLYSSTKTVLELTGDRLAADAVVVLDEFFNHPGWQQHEFRAWDEFIERTGRTFEYPLLHRQQRAGPPCGCTDQLPNSRAQLSPAHDDGVRRPGIGSEATAPACGTVEALHAHGLASFFSSCLSRRRTRTPDWEASVTTAWPNSGRHATTPLSAAVIATGPGMTFPSHWYTARLARTRLIPVFAWFCGRSDEFAGRYR